VVGKCARDQHRRLKDEFGPRDERRIIRLIALSEGETLAKVLVEQRAEPTGKRERAPKGLKVTDTRATPPSGLRSVTAVPCTTKPSTSSASY
jgi:hypothetical protein